MTQTGQFGFTLFELLVGVVVVSILAVLAVPNFSNLLRNQRIANESNQLMGALNLARVEAAKRRRTITLCPSTDGTSCTGGKNWENGYILFVNNDADSPPVVDTNENVLRIFPAADAGITLRASANFEFSISVAATTFTNLAGTFTFCDQRGVSRARGILINAVGRARASQDTDGNEIHEDRDATDLACP